MKIVITSHGDLCEGILISYAMIAGDTSHFTVVKLDEKGISDFSVRLNNVLDSLLTSNEFVIVLSDIVGGTPYNETFRYLLANPDKKVFLISGLNLPMLIQAGSASEDVSDIHALLDSILQAGQDAISLAPTAITNNDDLDF